MKTKWIISLSFLSLVYFYSPQEVKANKEEDTSTKSKVANDIALSVNIRGKLRLCSAGDKGFVFLDVKGGNPPYSIILGNQEVDSYLFDLFPGSYTVSIKDNSGNKLTENFVIQPAIPIKLEMNQIQHAAAEDGKLGSASFNLKAYGSQKVKIEWSNGLEDVLEANNLTPGTYTVKVIDETGCDSTLSFDIKDQSELASLSKENKFSKSSSVSLATSSKDQSQSYYKSYSKDELMKIAEEIQGKIFVGAKD